MSPLEAAVGALVVAWPVLQGLGWQSHRRVAVGYIALTLAMITALLMTGGLRWPLLPGLVLMVLWEIQAVGIMIGDVPAPARSPASRGGRMVLALLLAVPLLALHLLVLPAVPPFTPDGPHPVGARDLELVDSLRAGGPRRLAARLWYPSETVDRPRVIARHRDTEGLERELAAALAPALSPWMMRGVTRGRIPAMDQSRLSTRQRTWSVVVLSHGLPGSPALFSRLAMTLASHGYVVLAVEHAGGSWGTRFADGSRVPVEVQGMRAAEGQQEHWLPVWEADGRFLLKTLRDLGSPTNEGILAGRLELARIGWVGQGIGATAGRSLASEGAVVAVVGLDPPADLTPLLEGSPVLLLGSGPPSGLAGDDRLVSTMPGAGPADFSELARWSPFLLRRTGLGGRVPAVRMEEWIRESVLDHLGRHLSASRDIGRRPPPRN